MNYQTIARRFRPQTFKQVVGQDAIVTTLLNALKFNRTAQAYLFSGPKGTGKTTLARLLAKALNCKERSFEGEACNACHSCKEITAGASLNVIEVDGASYRGIDDIRKLSETAGYASASGDYKVYILDEVHMLTKEAFNALLKILEEPPLKVKFFFATTEPHKILPPILSRCQSFQLKRLSMPEIMQKLRYIAQELQLFIEEEALTLLARRGEGSLRDAEVLLDQLAIFSEDRVTLKSLEDLLGIIPREIYFEIDRAGKAGDFKKAFEISEKIFNAGKDPLVFVEGLIEHFRWMLMSKLKVICEEVIPESEMENYQEVANFYQEDQILELIEYLLNSQQQMRHTPFARVYLELIILHIMQSHFQLPVSHILDHIHTLQKAIRDTPQEAPKLVTKENHAFEEDVVPSVVSQQEKSVHVEEKKTTKESSSVNTERKPSYYHDTLLQFSAVFLGGRLQRLSK